MTGGVLCCVPARRVGRRGGGGGEVVLMRRSTYALASFTPAPSCQGEGAGQQHAAAQAAQGELVIVAVEVQQGGAARFHLGYPCLQRGHFTDLGVLVHDFDVGAVHGAPAFGVGPAARVDVRQAYVQLGQVVFSHFQHFEFDGGRVVVLGPVELGEAGEHFLVRGPAGPDGWSSGR